MYIYVTQIECQPLTFKSMYIKKFTVFFFFQLVIEYLGCVFHGCQDCFLPQDILKIGISNMDALMKTRQRLQRLKQHVDVESVVTMQSCVWNKMKKENSQVAAFLAEFKSDRLERRLSMKQTFRGGLVS